MSWLPPSLATFTDGHLPPTLTLPNKKSRPTLVKLLQLLLGCILFVTPHYDGSGKPDPVKAPYERNTGPKPAMPSVCNPRPVSSLGPDPVEPFPFLAVVLPLHCSYYQRQPPLLVRRPAIDGNLSFFQSV